MLALDPVAQREIGLVIVRDEAVAVFGFGSQTNLGCVCSTLGVRNPTYFVQ